MEERDNIRYDLQRELRLLCYSLFFEENGWQKRCQNVTKAIDDFLANYSGDALDKLIGGEFPFANSQDEERTKVPMFLYMELIASVLEFKYGNAPGVDLLISKFRELREKTVNLSYDKRFDPEKHISNGIIDDIIDANGFIRLDTTYIGSKKVVSIECTRTYQPTRQRSDGEYVPLTPMRFKQNYPCLYEEDSTEYLEYKKIEAKELRDRFNDITGKYFKCGHLPTDSLEFDEMLIEEEIHPNIVSILRTISDCRVKYPDGLDGELLWIKSCQNFLNGIKSLERREKEAKERERLAEESKQEKMILESSQEEERRLAIKAARKRYSTQNPLLRWYREISGKQQRFDGIEFDDLTIEEINGLFSESRKRGK